jgi:hypothetical protein
MISAAVRTAPGWGGIGLGMVLLIAVSGAYSAHIGPEGTDWFNYKLTALKLHYPESHGWHDQWRQPLYPYVLGGLGESIGFVRAATWIASTAGLSMVLAAGLLGWALAGPWAGGVAAITLSLSPVVAAGNHWMNLYPMFGAAVGLAFAFTACAWRWRGPVWAGLAGLMGGLAWAIDVRGLSVLGLTLGCVFVGLAVSTPRGPTWRRALGPLGVLLLTSMVFPVLGQAVSVYEVVSVEAQGEVAHPKNLRQIERESKRVSGYPAEACDPALCTEPPDPHTALSAMVLNACNRYLARWNYAALTSDRSVPIQPLWPILFFVPLVLLPGRGGGRRTAAIAGILFGVAMLAYFRVATTLRLQPRYLAILAVFFASVVPIGLYKLADRCGGRRSAIAHVVGVVSALVAVAALGLTHVGPSGLASNHDRMLAALVHWFDEHIESEDTVRECADLHLEVHLLQGPSRPELAIIGPAHDEACRQYIESAPEGPGQRWLVTGSMPPSQPKPEEAQPRGDLDPAAHGWLSVADLDAGNGARWGVTIWRHAAP